MKLFGKKSINPLLVDIHSHLIPNIDDGAQSMEQSVNMIKELKSLGFKKVITTPHIHPRYPNTSEIIMTGLQGLQEELRQKEIEMKVEAAAEYFVDEAFYSKVTNNETILSFGDRYVLVESSFLNKPVFFESVMFDLQSKGYRPVLAHPERYQFLEGSIEWLEELKSIGVLLQVTLGSIGGYYGAAPHEIGNRLLQKDMVDFLGSDLHRGTHLEFMVKGLKSREIQKSITQKRIKNQELL